MSRTFNLDPRPWRCPDKLGGCGELMHSRPDTPTQCSECHRWWSIDPRGVRRACEVHEIPAAPATPPDDSTEEETPVSKPKDDRTAWLVAITAHHVANNEWPTAAELAAHWSMGKSGATQRCRKLVAEGLVCADRTGAGRTSVTRFRLASAEAPSPGLAAASAPRPRQQRTQRAARPGVRACRECGCTDLDCRGCIERTGEPCWWVEDDLCSACQAPDAGAAPSPGSSARKRALDSMLALLPAERKRVLRAIEAVEAAIA